MLNRTVIPHSCDDRVCRMEAEEARLHRAATAATRLASHSLTNSHSGEQELATISEMSS